MNKPLPTCELEFVSKYSGLLPLKNDEIKHKQIGKQNNLLVRRAEKARSVEAIRSPFLKPKAIC